jgi:hypothetical protein
MAGRGFATRLGCDGLPLAAQLVRHFRRDLLETLEAAGQRHLAIDAAEFDENCPLLALEASLDHPHVLPVEADDLHRERLRVWWKRSTLPHVWGW